MYDFAFIIYKIKILIIIIIFHKFLKARINYWFVPLLELDHIDRRHNKWIFFRKFDFKNEFVPLSLILIITHENLKMLP